MRSGVEVAGLTDVGCQRHNNEDRFSYWEPAADAEFRQKGRLAIVADGMGGYEGGQEASRIAIETVEQIYASTANGDPQTLLTSAFQAAHERILRFASQHPELHGMGTTCTAVALVADNLYYAHVGDSRLYLLRAGQISRLSHDHSYVSRLVEHGLISSEEAENHPQRHILTAALGAGGDIVPDQPENAIPLQNGDILLLCTDGLWGLVSDEEIQSVLSSYALAEAGRQLIETAKKRGGPDNITLQVLKVCFDGRG